MSAATRSSARRSVLNGCTPRGDVPGARFVRAVPRTLILAIAFVSSSVLGRTDGVGSFVRSSGMLRDSTAAPARGNGYSFALCDTGTCGGAFDPTEDAVDAELAGRVVDADSAVEAVGTSLICIGAGAVGAAATECAYACVDGGIHCGMVDMFVEG